ncbi:LysM domain-containing protein [Novosphingobium lubricantis]|jgi:hypothetical protein
MRSGRNAIRLAAALVAAAISTPNVVSMAFAAKPQTQGGEDAVTYVIRRNETLYTLARQYLTRAADFQEVQTLNRIADPYHIPVGTPLRIPLRLLRGDPLEARVVALRGTVQISTGTKTTAGKVGMTLAQGSLLETGDDGFLTIELPNGSRTSLPTRTRLRLDHLRRIRLTGSVDYDFTVETGKVDTRAAPLGPDRNSRFRIRTPRAITAVRGTRFRVGYTLQDSLAEVLEGTVAAGAPEATPEPLEKGFGAVVSASGALSKEPLLPAPDLVAPGKVQIDPDVRLDLAPVAQATSYHVQIGADAGFADVIAEQFGEAPTFTIPNIPNGRLFVRISALAASGLEGNVQTFAMRRALTGLSASASRDADTMRFVWGGDGEGTRTYHFQLVPARPDAIATVDEPGLESKGISVRGLRPGVYQWRVGVRQVTDMDGEEPEITESWLPFETFTIAAPE